MRGGVPMAVAALVAGALAAGAAHASDPTARCAAVKLRAAGHKTQGKLDCEARGALHGGGADPACLARVEAKFAAAWARIEARGGCALTRDVAAVESRVDQLVADLVAAIPPTTNTTTTQTTTSSCPPTTAFYCGDFCPPSPPVALCPPGMTCTTSGPSCTCTGPAPPCGDLNGRFCSYGECPPGQTCRIAPGSTGCILPCSCQ